MIRVAGYCRVSTDREDQRNSFAAQQRYFREYIERQPDWELYEIYADEGISGTSTRRRSRFLRMIADAAEHKFQLILTKEVSRFSRNLLDTIRYTRELKQLGVGVLFLNDGIHTLEPDAELRLSIMASVAQEESRRTSERIRWGQTRQMESGVVFGHSLLGYTVKDGILTVEPEGAAIVRRIFHMYGIEKKGTSVIAAELEAAGLCTSSGNPKWSAGHLLKILRNEKYTGDLIQKKTITPDYLTHEKKRNRGEEETIVLRDHHEAIIDRELWETVQRELTRQSRKTEPSLSSVKHPFSGKIRCGKCGAYFISRLKYRKDGSSYRRWRCAGNCGIGHLLRNDTAEELVSSVLASLPLDRGKITENIVSLVKAVQDDPSGEKISVIRSTLDDLLNGRIAGEALERTLVEQITVHSDHRSEVKLTGLSAVFLFEPE